MQRRQRDYKNWKEGNKPYRIAFVLAVVVFMLCAPEVNEGSAMEPTLNDGDALIVSKTSYNPKKTKIILLPVWLHSREILMRSKMVRCW